MGIENLLIGLQYVPRRKKIIESITAPDGLRAEAACKRASSQPIAYRETRNSKITWNDCCTWAAGA